ncbi:MAG: 30S ribosomal protein S6 [Pirellulaceae bacterium]
MASNVYECLFILDSNRYARDPNGVAATVPAMVEKLGGEVLANRLWNEQKLAYPIKGQRKGTYWLTYFQLASDKLTPFNRACRLNDNIVRHLAIRVDPRLVDVLVSHALGKPVVPAGEKKGKAGDAPAKEPAKEPAAAAAESGKGG